jgi:hypothetical protein
LGGDSWATLPFLNWLFAQPMLYNDISAGHIKQNSQTKSVLRHAGHSDGQQADLRYWDGQGGFT